MGVSKLKGDLAEIEVMRISRERGYCVSMPFGEDAAYDLVVDRNGRLDRVQCKFAASDGERVVVRCRSTNGWGTRKYRPEDVDWIATYDVTSGRCYFVPSSLLGGGRATLTLRLTPARNGQSRNIRLATDFLSW